MHDFVFTYLSFYLQTLFHLSTILTLLTFTSNIKIFLFNLFLMYCFVYSPQGCQLPHCHPLTYPLPGLARGGAGNSCGNIVATLVCQESHRETGQNNLALLHTYARCLKNNQNILENILTTQKHECLWKVKRK